MHRSSEDVHGRGEDGREVCRALPNRRRGRDDRSQQPPPPQPGPHSRAGGTGDRAAAVAAPAGPVQIADRFGLPAPTVRAVLVRCRINRLTHIDRVTGEPLRRYEHDHPGSLIHVDVTKSGNIPDGGGHRYVGRQQGACNKRATAVLRRAVAWFADRGVTAERVLSDNGSAYRSHAWRDTCTELGVTPETDPALPASNKRQDRALPPAPGRGMGLRPLLPLRSCTPSGATGVAALL